MKLYFMELKKILRPIPLLVLLLFIGVFVFSLIVNQFDYMTSVHETCDDFAVAADLTEVAGNSPTKAELDAAIDELTIKYKAELADAIQNSPVLQVAGITDYDSYLEIASKIQYSYVVKEENFNPEEWQAIPGGPAYDADKDYSLTPAEKELSESGILSSLVPAIKIRFLTRNYPDEYSRIDIMHDYTVNVWDYNTPNSKELIDKIYTSGAINNILPGFAMENLNLIYPLTAILLIISLCILLAPVITKDNMARMDSLQYSSKAGRKILKIQLAAMLTVGALLSIFIGGGALLIFVAKGFHSFLNSGLNSFMTTFDYSLFTGNYMQYFFSVFGMLFTVSIAATFIIFSLSKLSRQYISLLLGVVPLTAILTFLMIQLFKSPFSIIDADSEALYQIIPIPFIEAYICGLLLVIGFITAMIVIRRQQRAEI
ncbi:MAG: hypothetical protein LBL93_06780 [Ruminococcus sp.]|jgi:hypothetical protein|nr:hypothetical protein [Ruminococcus sp.]